MGAGAILEPVIVVTLLFGGAWINRAPTVALSGRASRWQFPTGQDFPGQSEEVHDEEKSQPAFPKNRSLSPSLMLQESRWRQRQLCFLGWTRTVESPNTAVFKNRFLSRVLQKFPFLVEAWYWALIYWVSIAVRDIVAPILTDILDRFTS